MTGSPDWRVELRGGAGDSSGNVWATDQAGVLGPVCQEYHWSGGDYSKYGDWGKHEADVVCRYQYYPKYSQHQHILLTFNLQTAWI